MAQVRSSFPKLTGWLPIVGKHQGFALVFELLPENVCIAQVSLLY
jgi:hypothetical protein